MISLPAGLVHTALLGASACFFGRFLAARFGRFKNPALQTSLEAALGLLFLSYLMFLAVFFRLVLPQTLWFITGLVAATGLYEIFYRVRGGKWHWPRLTPESGALGLYFIAVIACAWLPASDRDELIYHLEIPRQWLKTYGDMFFRDNVYGYFPQAGEMLMLLGLGTAGEFAAKLSHTLFGGFAAAALYGFTREKLNRQAAWLAVFLFLSVPSVFVIFPLAYADLSYTLYAFLAMAATLKFFEEKKNRWIFLAGILAGASCAVKYTGIQYSMLLALLILGVYLFRREAPEGIKACLRFLIPAVILPLPYLIRNALLTGWPLFPFQTGDFLLNPLLNWDAERAQLYLGWLGSYGMLPHLNSFLSVVLAPVLVWVQGQFNEPAFYDGVLGPVFLLVPLLLASRRKDETSKILLVFTGLFLLYWTLSTRQVRFLVPLLPVLCFLLAYGWDAVDADYWLFKSGKKIKKALTTVLTVLMLCSLSIGVREVFLRGPLPFLSGKESREDYLRRNVPVYGIYREANGQVGPQEQLYLIHGKNYGYYLNVPWRGDFIFERYELNRDFETQPSEGILKSFFKERKITHLLLDQEFMARPEIGFQPEALAVFQDFLKSQELLAEEKSYRLYKLKP